MRLRLPHPFAFLLIGPLTVPLSVAAQGAPIRVQGTVYDSLRHAPLGGASIMLRAAAPRVGTEIAGTTDSLGHFALDGVPPGAYTIELSHPELAAIGLTTVTADADVAPGRPEIKLFIPSFETFWRYSCGRYPPADSLFLAGFVRRAANSAPVAGATVELSWSDRARGTPADTSWHVHTLSTSTDETGAYGFCGLPTAAGIRIEAQGGNLASGNIDLPIGPSSVRWYDLLVGELDPSGKLPMGAITGRVTRAGGMPLPGATVRIDSQTVVTDSAGRFTLVGVAAGTRQLEFLSVGSRATSATADVRPGRTVSIPGVQLEPVVVLNTVRVEESVFTRLAKGVTERRRIGLGRFIDSTQLRGVYFLEGPFSVMPGTRLVRTRDHKTLLVGKLTAVSECPLNLFIDGARIYDQDYLWSTPADEIAMIEIYPRGLLTPVEFIVPGSVCGAVVVWTKRFNR